jgi:hypothetical protein
MSFFKSQFLGWAPWLRAIILTTKEVEIRRMVIPGQPRQKVCETPSQPTKIWVLWCMPVNPATWEA